MASDGAARRLPVPARGTIRAFNRSLPMQLMRAREAVMQRFRPHLRAHGLTDQQWRILRALVEAQWTEMLILAAECCIHPASLSRIVPRLEERGLIARRADAVDQRRVAVAITEAGRTLFEAMSERSEAIYRAIEDELGAANLDQIYRALDETIAILGAAGEEDDGDE